MKKLRGVLEQATALELKVLLKLYQDASFQNPIKGEFLSIVRDKPQLSAVEIAKRLRVSKSKAVRIAVWLKADVEWVIQLNKEMGSHKKAVVETEEIHYDSS